MSKAALVSPPSPSLSLVSSPSVSPLPFRSRRIVTASATAGSFAAPATLIWSTARLRSKAGSAVLSTRKSAAKCCAGGSITEISESQFSETVLNSNRPVLVEFIATWCGPCRLIAPAMEWIAQEYKDRLTVIKIDHDANPKLIEEYKVYGLPTLILFKNGQEVPESRREGAITKVKLKEYLDPLLDSMSVAQ